MDFDLDTDQLQIRTDSDEGIIRVRFTDITDEGTVSGPGIKIGPFTPPTAKYTVKNCVENGAVEFELPDTTTPRVWTVGILARKLTLRCNGVVIFDIDLKKDFKCENGWSLDFARIVFPENKYLNGGKADTASDFVRKYSSGMTI